MVSNVSSQRVFFHTFFLQNLTSYDTLLGVRGELNVQVKLQFFGDMNPFKDSSASVQFFTMSTLPPTHQLTHVLGFVSAIDNEDDPEYASCFFLFYIFYFINNK